MDIEFASRKQEKIFQSAQELQKVHGSQRAKLIQRRVQALRAANHLGVFWPPLRGPERTHELTKNRAGQISMDLDHPYRLLFVPNHDPRPTRPEGGLDWFQVTAVTILGVEDTHD